MTCCYVYYYQIPQRLIVKLAVGGNRIIWDLGLCEEAFRLSVRRAHRFVRR